MKKFIFPLLLLLTFISSCTGNRETKEQELQDSIPISDSIETAYQDSIREDSLIISQIEEQFMNPLTLTKGKESKKWIGDQTDPNISVPLTIKNNTDIAIEPNDYYISYTFGYTAGVDEDGDGMDDYIDGFDKKAKKKGVKIAPQESVTIIISEKEVTDISNIKLKINLTREDFEKRFRERKAIN